MITSSPHALVHSESDPSPPDAPTPDTQRRRVRRGPLGAIARIRQRVHRVLEALDDDPVARAINLSLAVLVALNALAVVLETVPSIEQRWSRVFGTFETISVTIFLVEYLLRLWSCTTTRTWAHPVSGRLRFAARPLSIIDAVAIAPALLPGEVFLDLRYVRVMRLVRMLRVLKFARYTQTVRTFARVVREKRADLLLIGLFLALLLVVSSASMYFAEHETQPEAFNSIPAAMWWAMQTLTTVGYGDLVPVTPWGKFLGTLIALLGIGFFALPAGILAAGFAEELERKKREMTVCAKCGHLGVPKVLEEK